MRYAPARLTSPQSRSWLPVSSISPVTTDTVRDTEFLDLLSSYRDTGGLAQGEELTARRKGDSFLQLARDIANRRVIHFVWRDIIWLPLFQFEPAGHAVRSDIQMLIGELSGALDDWEMAQWFVEPNTCLHGELPITQTTVQFRQVHDAARSLRYLRCN